MIEDINISYAEIDKILSFMEDKYVKKIPYKMRELFKNEKEKNYEVNINPAIPLYQQNLQRKTLSILAMLNINYWCENEEEKQELIKIYDENDKKRETELRENYNPDNLFKNRKLNQGIESNNTALIEYREENLIKRIFKKIMNFFK